MAPLRSNGVLISETAEKANILNDQYSSVFTNEEDKKNIPDKGQSNIPPLPYIVTVVDADGVEKLSETSSQTRQMALT